MNNVFLKQYSVKATVCSLALVAGLGMGMIAEAGSIPANKLPLHTYAIRHVDCYKAPGGTRQGWIDPGDYVIVTQIRSGWAYGSYPTKNGRVSRWFKADDLVNNVGFANQEKHSPQNKVNIYKDSSYRSAIGAVWGQEPITVISNSGDSRQVIYKISGGYKMGWVPSSCCLPLDRPAVNTNGIKGDMNQDGKVDQTDLEIMAQIRVDKISATEVHKIVGDMNGDGNLDIIDFSQLTLLVKENKSVNWDSRINTQLANTNSAAYTSLNSFPKGQCTWYAWGRMKEVTGKSITFKTSSGRHAKYWPKLVNNCTVDNNLTSKCVAVRFTGGGGYGHVVFVEYVDNSNVYYTEDNVNSNTNRKVRKESISNFRSSYTKFIH